MVTDHVECDPLRRAEGDIGTCARTFGEALNKATGRKITVVSNAALVEADDICGTAIN